jgi:Uma2 family endonuclease
MTIEAFLAWQSGREQRYELIGGEPVAMAGGKLRHDRVTGNAFSEIRRRMRSGGSPCDAFTADIGIRTPAGNIRRPDVSVLCPPFDEEATTSDSPRLIVEVLSESTERVDRLTSWMNAKPSSRWTISSWSTQPGSTPASGSGMPDGPGTAPRSGTRTQ